VIPDPSDVGPEDREPLEREPGDSKEVGGGDVVSAHKNARHVGSVRHGEVQAGVLHDPGIVPIPTWMLSFPGHTGRSGQSSRRVP
jgi:hypothetical protein